jgi:hypothetical protein
VGRPPEYLQAMIMTGFNFLTTQLTVYIYLDFIDPTNQTIFPEPNPRFVRMEAGYAGRLVSFYVFCFALLCFDITRLPIVRDCLRMFSSVLAENPTSFLSSTVIASPAQ